MVCFTFRRRSDQEKESGLSAEMDGRGSTTAASRGMGVCDDRPVTTVVANGMYASKGHLDSFVEETALAENHTILNPNINIILPNTGTLETAEPARSEPTCTTGETLGTSAHCTDANVDIDNLGKPILVNLPPELHLKIFSLLDRTTSTCLGLCTKKFYSIHRSMRGTVSLLAWHSYPPNRVDGKRLWELLVSWMEPKYEFNPRGFKFLPPDEDLTGKYERYYVAFAKREKAKWVDLKEAGGYVENLIWYPLWD